MIFFLNLDQGSPSILGADIERNYVKNCEQSNLEGNAYVKRQIGEIEKEKNLWSHSTKSRNVQRKKNVEKCKNHQKKRFEEGLKSKSK